MSSSEAHRKHCRIALILAATLGCAVANATVTVRGTPDALSIEATNATQSDLLDAVSAHIGMKVHVNAVLDDRLTFSLEDTGLRAAIERCLPTRSFVLYKSATGRFSLHILNNALQSAPAGRVNPNPSGAAAVGHLADSDPSVRADAVHDVIASNNALRFELVASLLHDPEATVRRAAIEALGESEEDAATAALTARFDSLSVQDRTDVIESLADNRTVGAARLLEAALQDAALVEIAAEYLAERRLHVDDRH